MEIGADGGAIAMPLWFFSERYRYSFSFSFRSIDRSLSLKGEPSSQEDLAEVSGRLSYPLSLPSLPSPLHSPSTPSSHPSLSLGRFKKKQTTYHTNQQRVSRYDTHPLSPRESNEIMRFFLCPS
mmetsp:Transcript_19344/g.39172  ORF Transcript_19344/g.39172 Transcript_19344/m.39172 type:complete len:124 (+) Transcript_19344:450-821(+)